MLPRLLQNSLVPWPFPRLTNSRNFNLKISGPSGHIQTPYEPWIQHKAYTTYDWPLQLHTTANAQRWLVHTNRSHSLQLSSLGAAILRRIMTNLPLLLLQRLNLRVWRLDKLLQNTASETDTHSQCETFHYSLRLTLTCTAKQSTIITRVN